MQKILVTLKWERTYIQNIKRIPLKIIGKDIEPNRKMSKNSDTSQQRKYMYPTYIYIYGNQPHNQEVKIKTSISYHYIPTRLATNKSTKIPNVNEDVQQLE